MSTPDTLGGLDPGAWTVVGLVALYLFLLGRWHTRRDLLVTEGALGLGWYAGGVEGVIVDAAVLVVTMLTYPLINVYTSYDPDPLPTLFSRINTLRWVLRLYGQARVWVVWVRVRRNRKQHRDVLRVLILTPCPQRRLRALLPELAIRTNSSVITATRARWAGWRLELPARSDRDGQ